MLAAVMLKLFPPADCSTSPDNNHCSSCATRKAEPSEKTFSFSSNFFPFFLICTKSKIIVLCFHSLVCLRAENRNLIRNAKSELNYQRIKKFNQVSHSILNCDQNKGKGSAFFLFMPCLCPQDSGWLQASALHLITQQRWTRGKKVI